MTTMNRALAAPHLDATVAQRRASLLAELVLDQFRDVGPGHCARVDYLGRDEAVAIAAAMRQQAEQAATALDIYVLTRTNEGDLAITSDRAIELRNRKLRPLCLFMPDDVVDGSASSLANSFAGISSIDLYRDARKRAQEALPDPVVGQAVRGVFTVLTRRMKPTDRDALDLILAAETLSQQGERDRIGRELWRVGLVPDGREDFADRLQSNRTATEKISRPLKAAAGTRLRVADARVDPDTAVRLTAALADRPLQDPRQWGRSLLDTGPTFEDWRFPETEVSDLGRVTVDPFADRQGSLLKGYGKTFVQPHGPGGELFLLMGGDRKVSLKVSWKTEPKTVRNVAGWRVQVMFLRDTEAGDTATLGGNDVELDLPDKEVKGDNRTVILPFNFEIDTEPENEIVARVVAVDETGTEITDADGKPIADISRSFFIKLTDANVTIPFTERRTTFASLAEGQLLAALDAKAGITDLSLSTPEWRDVRGTRYFSAKIPDARRLLTIGLSGVLTDLQEDRTLAEPRNLGRYQLDLDEIREATLADITAIDSPELSPRWDRFLSARTAFFQRLRLARRDDPSGSPRDTVEVADWTDELVGAVTRYGQAYRGLLRGLSEDGAPDDERVAALSIDSLSVNVRGRNDERAVITLPTHPLRALWMASHARLLGHWRDELLEIPKPAQRKERLDQALVHELRPVNVPPFPIDPATSEPFVFFRTLAYAHGIALPAAVRDPIRRVLDLTRIFGLDEEPGGADDRAPAQLGRHLERFATVHPYADPLQIAIVNPDRGDMLAAALEKTPLFRPGTDEDGDDTNLRRVPLLDVSAFVLDREDLPRTNLSALRRAQGGASTRHPSDFLYPKLATRVRALDDLLKSDNPDLAAAHLAVVSDLCAIAVETAPPDPERSAAESLYGLLPRFRGSRIQTETGAGTHGVTWRYHVTARASRAEHPGGAAFGPALSEGLDAVSRATARLLSPGTSDVEPVITVSLSADLVTLLDTLHDKTDWVVTIDRFFAVDYFDSPNDPTLRAASARHLIDYSPDFADGLGHRIIVSTAWRDEVESTLRRALVQSGHPDGEASEAEVPRLLESLKRVSGRLALESLQPSGGNDAVGLAVTLRWLEATGQLTTGILVPLDVHRDLLADGSRTGKAADAPERSALMLIGFGRGTVDLTLFDVRNQRGPLGDLQDDAAGMSSRLQATARAIRHRFFDPGRIDAALQRMVLGNMLRFYADRALRHGLTTVDVAHRVGDQIAQYERNGAELVTERLQGVIVSLGDEGRDPIETDTIRVTVLTAADLDPVRTPRAKPTVVGGRSREEPRVAEPSPDFDAVDDLADGSEHSVDEESTEVGQIVDPVRSENDFDGPDESSVPTRTEPPGLDPEEPARMAVSRGAASAQVILGDEQGRPVSWTPSVTGSPHLFISGIPGQGKSVAVRNLIRGLGAAGVPSLVFDFHGEFAESADWAPSSGPLSCPAIADAADGLPFTPFALGPNPKRNDVRDNAQAIAEIFDHVCDLGDIQRDTLMTTIRDAYDAANLRANPAARVPTMDDIRRGLEQQERDNRTRNVLARCRTLLEFGLFLDDSAEQRDFRGLLDGGLIVRLDGVRSEQVQDAAGAFVIRKVYREMFDWGRTDRLRLAIVLDEAHRLAKDSTLPKILKEGRKYGVLVVAASQGLADFHPDVLGNVGTKVSFRMNNPDSRRVAGYFSGDQADLTQKIERLGVGEAVVQTTAMAHAAQVRMRRS